MFDLDTVKKINDSPFRVFLTITGGGTGFLGNFLKVPGGSGTLLGAYVPYDKAFLEDFIGCKPENYSSPETARKMAVNSYREALKLVPKEVAIGIGVSCSLFTNGERDGRKHKISLAFQTRTAMRVFALKLEQGRSREDEEEMVETLIFALLVKACQLSDVVLSPKFKKEEIIMDQQFSVLPDFVELFHNPKGVLFNFQEPFGEKVVLYPGSFSIFHDGHRQIVELAQKILGQRPMLEISLSNTDKPKLDYIDLMARYNTLEKEKLMLTNAPLFGEKILALQALGVKEIVFIVGLDVFERLWNCKYYRDRVALAHFQDLIEQTKTKFLVFSRNGRTIDDLNKYDATIEWAMQFIIESPEAKAFNNPVSSSILK